MTMVNPGLLKQVISCLVSLGAEFWFPFSYPSSSVFPTRSLGFTILGEIFPYVTVL